MCFITIVVTKPKTYAVPMSGYSQEKSFEVVAETRRKWSAAERKQIVAETEAASVSWWRASTGSLQAWCSGGGARRVLRARRAHASQRRHLCRWLCRRRTAAPVAGADRGMIEIELAGGRRLRVRGRWRRKSLEQVIAILEGR